LSCGELERLASFLRDKIILQFQSHKCSQFYSDRRASDFNALYGSGLAFTSVWEDFGE
jgi:hypothetical protein